MSCSIYCFQFILQKPRRYLYAPLLTKAVGLSGYAKPFQKFILFRKIFYNFCAHIKDGTISAKCKKRLILNK